MAERKLILCDCLGSQAIDPDRLEAATGIACSRVHNALCMEQSQLAAKAIEAGGAIIACQQERHFFEELAGDLDVELPDFVDIRDRAGWSQDSRPNAPKMAALVADAVLEASATKVMDVESSGLCLILGDPDVALSAARQLGDMLNVTVLLAPGSNAGDGDDRRFDIVHGRLAGATGAFGGFEVRIDALQERIRGGRGEPALTPPKDGARSVCDIILDLSGGNPLFSAHEKREGYLRADPKNTEARIAAIIEASQLVGTFEKPLYVRLESSLCAHSRAQKTGCTRCLDLCPTGAITPNGDHVEVDAMLCAGCGACSAVCPSGAISYDAPPVSSVFKRIEALASTWRKLSDDAPRLLVHDAGFGAEAIRLSARHGRGLPADVIPMEISSLAAFGHAEMLASLASGFATVTTLVSPTTEKDGLGFEVELANAIGAGAIGGGGKAFLIEPGDPDVLEEALWIDETPDAVTEPILPLGNRRQVTRLSAKALNGDDTVIALPQRAPYGSLDVDTAACTLCLSCVSLCPSGALADNPDMPQLRFQEDACLQCGICAHACPENAISLVPRLNLASEALSHRVVHEEEPFACIECGAPFGVRSTVMRITEKLAGKHSMFASKDAIRMIQMCDNCRVNAAYHSENNPFAAGERPKVRTTEDYQSKRKDH